MDFANWPSASATHLRAGSIPGPHRDPFDRMIAAQGLIETLRIATPDPEIADLGADTIW